MRQLFEHRTHPLSETGTLLFTSVKLCVESKCMEHRYQLTEPHLLEHRVGVGPLRHRINHPEETLQFVHYRGVGKMGG